MKSKIFICGILLFIVSALSNAQDSSEELTIKKIQAGSESMTRVTGIGGIFIKAKDPEVLQNWYKKHLGIDVQVWGGASFKRVDGEGKLTLAQQLG